MKTRKATAERRKFNSSTEQLDFNGNTFLFRETLNGFKKRTICL